jgi:hypothetical protein
MADDASLDELLAKIKGELEKLKPIFGPIIDLEVAREPQGSRTEGCLTDVGLPPASCTSEGFGPKSITCGDAFGPCRHVEQPNAFPVGIDQPVR